MFEIPGFYPASMTDDELLNKQMEISRRLGFAARFSTSNMSEQLMAMITAIEAERRDRIMRYVFNERLKMFPDIIETEPDLAMLHKRQAEDTEADSKMAQRRKQGRERITLSRSSAPVQETQARPIQKSNRPDTDKE